VQAVTDTHGASLAQRIKLVLSDLGWRESIDRIPISHLRCLLANGYDGWLQGDTVDLAAGCLRKALDAQPNLRQRFHIAPSEFFQFLTGQRERWARATALQDAVRLVCQGCEKTFAVVNINSNHWVVFVVNYKARTIAYGQ
jgi:hypothetical protein